MKQTEGKISVADKEIIFLFAAPKHMWYILRTTDFFVLGLRYPCFSCGPLYTYVHYDSYVDFYVTSYA